MPASVHPFDLEDEDEIIRKEQRAEIDEIYYRETMVLSAMKSIRVC